MTIGLSVIPYIEIRKGNARRTKQAEEVLSRGTVLQFFSLVLDELPGDFVHISPVLQKVYHPRALVPLQNPGK